MTRTLTLAWLALILAMVGCVSKWVPGLPMKHTGQPVDPVPVTNLHVVVQSSSAMEVTAAGSRTHTVLLSWTPPKVPVAGYHVYQRGTSTNVYLGVRGTSLYVAGLSDGLYYFKVCGYILPGIKPLTNGIEGPFSNEVHYLAYAPKPKPAPTSPPSPTP